MDSDFYSNSDYTKDISTKMQIPQRLDAHGGLANGVSDIHRAPEFEKTNSHMYSLMEVPDRILLAGSEQHVPAHTSTPPELMIDQRVLPPTPEHVRVQTPPRSIKLGDPTISHYDSTPSTPQNLPSRALPGGAGRGGLERGASLEAEQGAGAGRGEAGQSDTGVSVYEELQNMRRQIAKMNHRLMAVELENQQQQQREMVLTVMVSAYFAVKALLWLNKM